MSAQQNIVEAALARAKRAMRGVFLFSFVVNLLLLTSPMFMLQVYDRVLLSRSESTLLGLMAIAVFLLLMLLCFEIIRNLMLQRISVRLDADLGDNVVGTLVRNGDNMQALHDLNTVRNFTANPYLLALFDIPWLPAYLLVVYALHPALGHVGLIGAALLFGLALLNDRFTRDASKSANEAFGAANQFVEHSLRNQSASAGMGMIPALLRQWRQAQNAGLGFQGLSSERTAYIGSVAKVVRQLIQIAVLATGAFLAIQDITTAGVMIAASIIIGRALTPIEQSIQGWRALARAKESYHDLTSFMQDYEPLAASTPLPVPHGNITVRNLLALGAETGEAAAGSSGRPILKNIHLDINAGELVGITGPSGCGKTTLARHLLGIDRPQAGEVRIDGAELTPEHQAQLSAYFGYLPQDVELFDGTVAENIARFRECGGEDVVEAAKLAGAHELILGLPAGYETPVGPAGLPISGGQKQRIALARAFFGEPKLLVLDEPSSSLDHTGRQAVVQALGEIKRRGITCIVIAHQPSLFAPMDKLVLMAEGQIQQTGPRDAVMQTLNPQRQPYAVKADAAPAPQSPAQADSERSGTKPAARVVQAQAKVRSRPLENG